MNVGNNLIARLALYITPKSLPMFAIDDLELSNSQIDNAMGSTAMIHCEFIVRGLNHWIEQFEVATVGTLQGLLEKAVEQNLLNANITEILLNKHKHSPEDKLEVRDVSVIAKKMNALQWKIFASGFLNINLTEVEAMLPMVIGNKKTDLMNLLSTWRNINHPDATVEKLKKIIQESIHLDREIKGNCQRVIDEMSGCQMECEPINDENFNNLRGALDIQTITAIYEDNILYPAEREMIERYIAEGRIDSAAGYLVGIICNDSSRLTRFRESFERQGKLDVLQFLH